ncbi:hypothetical protein [Kribbella sp. NPDC051718]|uniref:hypothetical protein n=1 Tax=Kribbella sp. NPDC051718 TaxID=3155168 RepID=UPI00342EC18A
MRDELAKQWLDAAVPSWLYRWLMPLGWLAALATSVIGDDRPCSVADPTICGPDLTFSLALIPCLASFLGWWWVPRLAAAGGLVFLVLDLRYDDVQPARVGWTAYGAACMAVLLALTWSQIRRRELLARVHRVPVTIGPANPIGFTPALAGTAALVVAGFAVLGVMRWQVDREQVHLDRAVKTTAVVVGFKDDDLQLRLPDGSMRRTSSLDYPKKGDELPVLVDPQDADWVRLQAELADYTTWWTVAGGGWLLALLILRHDLVRRRARPRRTWSAAGLPVWIEPDGSMGYSVLPGEGSEQVLGFIALELDDDDAGGRLAAAYDVLDDFEEDDAPPPAAARREWRGVLGRHRGKALLVGELADGSWPTVALGEQVLRPATPFRLPRRSPWGVEEPGMRLSDLDDEPDADLEAVQAEPVAVLHDLPWRIPLTPPRWWMKPALIAALVGVPAADWVLVVLWDEWALAIVGAAAVAPEVILLARAVFQRVVVTSTALQIRGAVVDETVSWRDVEAVQIEDGDLILPAPGSWHVIAHVPKDRLEEVAGVFETLRRQAVRPQQSARRRLSPGAYVIGLYLVACAAVFAVLLLT